jgi:hypothetical protein
VQTGWWSEAFAARIHGLNIFNQEQVRHVFDTENRIGANGRVLPSSALQLDESASGGTDAAITSLDVDRVDDSNSKPSNTSFPASCSPTHADLGGHFLDAEPGVGGGPNVARLYGVGCINLVTQRGRTRESHHQVVREAGWERRSIPAPLSGLSGAA